ncbi:protein trichome birefringence-like 2 [Euphorbia lathyris]|uniref:protein trichome birefringence-like 2 n=1 Tax=Euphorbia lathyris TaxID=212925 RepID=UPI003314498A
MDAMKLAFHGQVLSPTRKLISGFVLWVCASLIILSVFLLGNSLNGRLVLFSAGTFNSSRVSWPFSFSTSSSVNNGNLNFTSNFKNGSINVEQGSAIEQIQEANAGNFSDLSENRNRSESVLEKAHLGTLFKKVKNESLVSEEGGLIRNSSLSGDEVTNGNGTIEVKFLGNSSDLNSSSSNREEGRSSGLEVEENQNTSLENCDIFDGRWVRDESKPYYPAGSCPHIDRDFDCHLNRRPDDGFLKWKWQPNRCNIPSFNATDFLERLRGQKLVFVGDSLNRNMWESLVCILRHSIENKKRVYEISGRTEFKKKGFYAFRFEDYNCTVDFVGSPFLVRESSFNAKNGTIETLRLDLMDQTTKMYHDADIIVFNTGHWWTHEKTSKGEDYYQEGNHVHSRLKVLEAYKRALMTWAKWVNKNIDGNRTQVFFRGYSVTHFRGGQWNSGGQCHKETEPIYNEKFLAKYPSKMRALELVLREMKSPVTYLNISRLTDYRKDGHPSIYRMQYKTTEEHIAAERSQDCSHWCLPGVPDSWNELLYASLLKAGRGSWRI